MGVKPHPGVVAIMDWYPCDFQKSLMETNWKLIAGTTEKGNFLDLGQFFLIVWLPKHVHISKRPTYLLYKFFGTSIFFWHPKDEAMLFSWVKGWFFRPWFIEIIKFPWFQGTVEHIAHEIVSNPIIHSLVSMEWAEFNFLAF